jgi:alkylated DNA nucleotide flippase Atl1
MRKPLAKGKTWRDKLNDSKDLPRIDRIEGTLRDKWGGGMMVIPAPREVDAMMKRVPRGKVVTINELRKAIAKKHGVRVGCPITTGIFAWIAAHAAAEAARKGAPRITPYWRTLKSGGELNLKYPGGLQGLKKKLQAEGHRVAPKGKRWVVVDFEKRLAKL